MTTFGKNRRLLTAEDYRQVFEARAMRSGQRELLVIAKPGTTGQHRLGLAIAKKHVRSAVARNTIKRAARETFRHLPASATPLDMILLSRPGADRLNRTVLGHSLRRHFAALLTDADRSSRPARKTTGGSAE